MAEHRDHDEGFPGARIPFWKMSGSGNDFVVIDNRAGLVPPDRAKEFTRLVCRRRIAVGADGVVLIESPVPGAPGDFRWRYLNADGSNGEMCGNGAMCGARFAHLQGIAPARCVFQTDSGPIHAEVDPDPACPFVQIAIADPGPVRPDIELNVLDQALYLHAIQVGVPHAVLLVASADDFQNLIAIGRAVRHHPAFAPAGTNLNVIDIRDGHALRMRTYERGVEDETLACGTGAVASSIIATGLGLVTPPVAVVTSSGLPLTVDFTWDGSGATAITLGGEARIVAQGEIWPEALA